MLTRRQKNSRHSPFKFYEPRKALSLDPSPEKAEPDDVTPIQKFRSAPRSSEADPDHSQNDPYASHASKKYERSLNETLSHVSCPSLCFLQVPHRDRSENYSLRMKLLIIALLVVCEYYFVNFPVLNFPSTAPSKRNGGNLIMMKTKKDKERNRERERQEL